MRSGDWIGVAIIALVILGALFGLSRLSKPYDVKTEEEFERRRKEHAGLLTAGMTGLQKILDPAAKRAAEVQEDFRRGIYDDKEEADDPPAAGDQRRQDAKR